MTNLLPTLIHVLGVIVAARIVGRGLAAILVARAEKNYTPLPDLTREQVAYALRIPVPAVADRNAA